MIVPALAAWETRDEPAPVALPEPETARPANPLRQGDVVRCPACGAEGEAWRWELDRPPRYQAWTVPCFKCRQCKHVFACRPTAAPE